MFLSVGLAGTKAYLLERLLEPRANLTSLDQIRGKADNGHMAEAVSIYHAKTQLSRLIARAEAGEEIVISRHGHPVARLGPWAPARSPRTPGTLKGRIAIHDGFDDFTDEDDRDWYGT